MANIKVQKLGRILEIDTSKVNSYLNTGWGLVDPKTKRVIYKGGEKENYLKTILAKIFQVLEIKDKSANIDTILAQIKQLKDDSAKLAETSQQNTKLVKQLAEKDKLLKEDHKPKNKPKE